MVAKVRSFTLRRRSLTLLLALLAAVFATTAVGAANGTDPVTTVAGGNGNGDANNQLSWPGGLALDSNGNLYIADTENHRIQKVDSEGTVTTVIGGNGQGSANSQLRHPDGVPFSG